MEWSRCPRNEVELQPAMTCGRSRKAWERHRGSRPGVGCFFFFQAEDGIRDLTVTGVQTCALPILMGSVCLAIVEFYTKYMRALLHGLVCCEVMSLLKSITSTRDDMQCPHVSPRSEEHTSELQSQSNLVCRLLLEKKKE